MDTIRFFPPLRVERCMENKDVYMSFLASPRNRSLAKPVHCLDPNSFFAPTTVIDLSFIAANNVSKILNVKNFRIALRKAVEQSDEQAIAGGWQHEKHQIRCKSLRRFVLK